jgi:hypothetical protein
MRSAPVAASNEWKLARISGHYYHLAWWVLFIVYIPLSASDFVLATSRVKSASLQVYNLLLQLLDDLEPPVQFSSQPVAVARRCIALAWNSCILNHPHSVLTDWVDPRTGEDENNEDE